MHSFNTRVLIIVALTIGLIDMSRQMERNKYNIMVYSNKTVRKLCFNARVTDQGQKYFVSIGCLQGNDKKYCRSYGKFGLYTFLY